MARILDPLAAVVAARVIGDDERAVDEPDALDAGDGDQLTLDIAVRDRVVVEVEADVGSLADLHGHVRLAREGLVRQRQEPRLLLGKGVADRPRLVLGPPAIHRRAVAEGLELGVEIVESVEGARREEGLAEVADRSLDAPLFVAPARRACLRGESVVGREVQHRGVEADRVAAPLDHRALEVVVEQLAWHATEAFEGVHVAREEDWHLRAEVEARDQPPRPAQDDDEGHQRALGAADLQRAEVGPVDLGLLPGESPEAEEGLGLRACAEPGDDLAQARPLARVAAVPQHRE